MHHRIDTALKALRQDPALTISDRAVERACREVGRRWRRRLPGPAAIVRWFLLQILLGNTAATHVTLLAERRFSSSAYCRARIGFTDAPRWLRERAAQPDGPLPALVVVPLRPGRVEPRAVKRRPKPYPRLTKPRSEMRKDLIRQWDTP